ncbi:hypothetical protein Acr_26g0004150 [Actinidia rufa]|uniref:Uncharacterized protein n=1 Tax=Actinidia rufa TaxID=165716 RepID=A0A7J0H2A8_9ERIC|nr:hypothetical protein Acr_26g0004150 [Actinidia rufa]
MRSRSEVGDLDNRENSLPSWIIDHLGEGSSSFMTDEVNQSPDLPREDPPTPEEVPMVAIPPLVGQDTRGGRNYNIYSPRRGVLLRGCFPSRPPFSHSPTIRPRLAVLQGDVQEDPAQRVPQQCQGVERKFFFASREDWEFSDGSSREYGVPSSVEEKGLYSVLALLKSKSFQRVFGPRQLLVSDEKNKGEDVPTSSGDASDSRQSQEEIPHGGHSRDSSIECIRTIRWTDRVLSCLPDQILLSILGANIRPILGAWELEIQGREDDHETHPGKGGGDRREAFERRVASSPTKKGEVIDSSKGKEEGTSTRAQKEMAGSDKISQCCELRCRSCEKALGGLLG